MVVALFLIMLAIPGLATLLGVSGTKAGTGESLAAAPRWPRHVREWFELPIAAKDWFRDHFAFRQELVRLHGLVSFDWLGVAKDNRVMPGKDGWLFYVEDPSRPLRSSAPLPEEEVERWAQTLELWNARVAEQGATLVVALCPDKQTIYPEALPAWARARGGIDESPAAQVVRRLRRRGLVAVADLRSSILAAKESAPGDPLYYRADSHWNELGGVAGFRAVAEALATRFPQVQNGAVNVSETPGRGGDLARFLGADVAERFIRVRPSDAHARFLGASTETVPLLPVTTYDWLVTERPTAPIARAVVFRDSFFTAMLPHVAEVFGRAVYSWQKAVDLGVVAREKPDVVIFQLVERALRWPPPQVQSGPPDMDSISHVGPGNSTLDERPSVAEAGASPNLYRGPEVLTLNPIDPGEAATYGEAERVFSASARSGFSYRAVAVASVLHTFGAPPPPGSQVELGIAFHDASGSRLGPRGAHASASTRSLGWPPTARIQVEAIAPPSTSEVRLRVAVSQGARAALKSIEWRAIAPAPVRQTKERSP